MIEAAMLHPLVLALREKSPDAAPTVSADDIALAESKLGFALPTLLADLYSHVGDGRFGPGYGLLSLTARDGERSLIDWHSDVSHEGPADPSCEWAWQWPRGVLPICDWGCAILSCLDCLNPPHAVLTFEFVEGPMELSFTRTHDSLDAWLQDWLNGVDLWNSMYEHAPERDRVVRNVLTGEPVILKGRKPRSRK